MSQQYHSLFAEITEEQIERFRQEYQGGKEQLGIQETRESEKMTFKVGDKVTYGSGGPTEYNVLASFKYNNFEYIVLDAPKTSKPTVQRISSDSYWVKVKPKFEVGATYKKHHQGVVDYKVVALDGDDAVVIFRNHPYENSSAMLRHKALVDGVYVKV